MKLSMKLLLTAFVAFLFLAGVTGHTHPEESNGSEEDLEELDGEILGRTVYNPDMNGFSEGLSQIRAAITHKCPNFRKGEDAPILQSLPVISSTEIPWDDAYSIELLLSSLENTAFQAQLTNNGTFPIQVLQPGSVLQNGHPFQMLGGSLDVVYASNQSACPSNDIDGFTGGHFDADDWLYLEPGESVEATVDAADYFDLSSGGDFDYRVNSSILAMLNGEYVSLPLISNTLKVTGVDGVKAAQGLGALTNAARLNKRTKIMANTCTRLPALKHRGSLNWAAQMCAAGAWAALAEGEPVNDRFAQYFHAFEKEARCYVASRLVEWGAEMHGRGGSARGPQSWVRCGDLYNFCNFAGNRAYRHEDRQDVINACPGLASFPHYSEECFVDNGATILMSLVTQIFFPSHGPATENIIMGMPDSTFLPWDQASKNAETYVWFAHSAFSFCPELG